MESSEVASASSPPQPQRPSSPDEAGGSKEDAARKKANVRKRTKTGCLTCRKRRIKCDEGRPICNNCIKSKRQCEGYNQRVVFKEPMGAFSTAPFSQIVLQQETSHALANQLAAAQAKSSSQTTPLQVIAPKPPGLDLQSQPALHYGQVYQGQQVLSPTTPFDFNQAPFGAPPISHSLSPTDQQQSHGLENHDYLPTPHTVDSGFVEHIDLPGRTQSSISGPVYVYDEPVGTTILPPDVDDLEYQLSDDDVSMAESDDDIQAESQSQNTFNALAQQSDLDNPLSSLGTRIRSFSTYAASSILATYLPSPRNSPLTDPKAAAVFWHFVHVTGPSMSLYERHPMDHSELSQPLPVSSAGHNIWTYTLPVVAFSHPALLQAMLALGSLQIAKLQKVPATAAMKHYHLAIRRVARNVRSTTRRTHPATVAASLLLAYFEVWSSDHNKWCNHMFGSSILFKEIPLGEMTRAILPLKRRKRRRQEKEKMQPFDDLYSAYTMAARNYDLEDVDVGLLSVLTGKALRPEDFGQLDGIAANPGSSRYYTDRDIENYEHFRDLYWWYTKMDVYQSILGGTKLFLDYDYWVQCPPRSPIGKLEAIYGTSDHLMLLLGRLVDFSSRDLARKRKATQGRFGNPASGSPPLFPGMLPTHGRVTVPMGFSPPRDTSPQKENADDIDMDGSTQAALQEWQSIRQAFEALRSRFGPEFEPLGREYADHRDSPFGPTLQYRTFSVAGVWMNYYMGLIHLYRAHPSMPPAAMIAAGMSAHQTGRYSIEIGRIAAGLADDCSNVTEISTLVGAAFIESCFCLFVAAIQFREDAQRHWVIRRLYDIARLTGWQSAKQIADGCESGWSKAHMIGKGPPYKRSANLEKQMPESIWIRPRRLDHRLQELESNEQRVVLAKSEQAHYAFGLLSVEQDLERLELKEGM